MPQNVILMIAVGCGEKRRNVISKILGKKEKNKTF